MGMIFDWDAEATEAGSGDGNGNGDGYGYGSGDGDGDGSGNYGSGGGYGYGDGYGDGDGDGSGNYGSGGGYGYGYGYGYGSGSCYGYGYGYGYGDGGLSDSFCCAIAAQYVSDGVVALWRSEANGYAANGGSLHTPAKVGDIVTSNGPLRLCGEGTLHATWHPSKWRGERLWVVALHGDVVIGNDKLGSLKREYLAEITFGGTNAT